MAEGSMLLDRESVIKSYSLLNHAENIISKHSNDDYLTDCIMNINKSIDHRLKLIRKIYSFDQMPYFSKKDLWKKLEKVKLIRKYLIEEINTVRNLLEHEYASPPGKDKCKYYIEAVWFFLKATDSICCNINDGSTGFLVGTIQVRHRKKVWQFCNFQSSGIRVLMTL